MKIALVTSMKYGLTQFIFRDVKALYDKGHEVRLFTLINKEGLYNPLPDWMVVPVIWWRVLIHHILFVITRPALYVQLLSTALSTKSFVNLAIAISFVRQMDDIDVIYAYFGDHKLYTGYYCKRITGIPLVVTIRAYELHWNPNWAMFKEALPYCDKVVTITQYNRDILVKKFGLVEDEIDIIRQIVDLEAYKYEPKIKILIVGFFAEKKGHDVLFKAIQHMNRDDIEVWVVGSMAPDRGWNIDIVELSKTLGIDHQVAFFGEQRGVSLRALYRECDIFCLPSRTDYAGGKEGFPNVIMEAMAFGKPVVSTRHAGIPDVVDRILVDENNVEQLAEALDALCDAPELQRELGRKNREKAEAEFSPANNDILERILLQYARRD